MAVAYLAFTCLNKLLFRLTLVPYGRHTHLLAITTNLVYLAYFSLACRRGGGASRPSPDAWDFALRGGGRWLLVGSGVAQALAFTVMPLFVRRLPGSSVTVIAQAMLPYSMLLSAIFLGRRFDRLQHAGVAVVILGILVSTYPQALAEAGAGAAGGLASAGLPFVLNALGLLVGYLFNAASFVFREAAVLRYEGQRPGERLSGDAVNLITAAWQGVVLWLFWPVNFMLLTPLSPGAYFQTAAAAALAPAAGALLLVYWLLNVVYVSVTLAAITNLSSVVVLLLSTLSVPAVALLFCLDLPMLGAAPFSWYSVAGLLVITAGMLVFNHKQLRSAWQR